MSTEFRRIVSEDPGISSSSLVAIGIHTFSTDICNDLDVQQSGRRSPVPFSNGTLIKSVERTAGYNDYANWALFLEAQGQSLDDLIWYGWDNPKYPGTMSCSEGLCKGSRVLPQLKSR